MRVAQGLSMRWLRDARGEFAANGARHQTVSRESKRRRAEERVGAAAARRCENSRRPLNTDGNRVERRDAAHVGVFVCVCG